MPSRGALLAFSLVCGICWLAPGATDPATPLTNVAALKRLAGEAGDRACDVRLEAQVSWAGPAGDMLILRDDSGSIQVEMDLHRRPGLKAGQTVLLEGRGVAGQGKLRELLVNNDGLHAPEDKEQSIYLEAGRHPIVVDWFNGPAGFDLKLDYSGPEFARRNVPNTALFRQEWDAEKKENQWAGGLEYRCYEGNWECLPDFSRERAVKSGSTTNLDLSLRTQDQWVGIQFGGFLEVARTGQYTFWLRSDDGSRLFLGSLHISVTGESSLPQPKHLALGQTTDEFQWAEVEGVITALRRCPSGGMEAELSMGTNRMHLELAESFGKGPELLSRVRAQGVFRSANVGASPVEARTASSAPCGQGSQLLVGSYAQVEVRTNPAASEDRPVNRLAELRRLGQGGQPTLARLRVEGTVLAANAFLASSSTLSWLVLQDDSGAALVEMEDSHATLKPGDTVVLEGLGAADGMRLNLRGSALVENDGVHTIRERTGSIFLRAGKHPLHLSWFNHEGSFGLNLDYQGPDLPRQRIPSGALVHAEVEPDTGEVRWAPGVTFCSYQGLLTRLPDPWQTVPINSGTAAHFDISLAGRSTEVAMEFSGFLIAPRDGVYTFWCRSDDGSRLFLDEELPLLAVTGSRAVPPPAALTPRQLLTEDQEGRWSQVEGTITFANQTTRGLELDLGSATGPMRILVPDSTTGSQAPPLNSRVRVTGLPQITYTPDGQRVAGAMLAPSLEQVELLNRGVQPRSAVPLSGIGAKEAASTSGATTNALPELSTIEKVKGLTREEAQRGYPVRIRGIITAPLNGGFFIQDASSAIFVSWEGTTNTTVNAGDYWEVEGKTYAEFAPNIDATTAVRLGTGTLPEPHRPTWDQLINGSLDTRYIEVQGIVTKAEGDILTLLTRTGKISVRLALLPAGGLRRYVDALIRIRGCLMPERNDATQQVEVGRIQLLNYSITLDEPAPTDPFAATLKRAPDLFLFDSRAGAIQPVRVAGQITHGTGLDYYVMESTNGFRLQLKAPVALAPGDQVEAVGFPDLSGPSPALHEALVRRTGHDPLPAPERVPTDLLLDRRFDATRVLIDARLTAINYARDGTVLELQAGTRGFLARMDGARKPALNFLPGSLLELTGVYAGHGGDLVSGRGIDSFELLLDSASDIRVLRRPSWWTLKHTLALVGAMGVMILGALAWITQLRRQVEDRSRELAVAIRAQEHAESQRALEAERTRVARDLHDDLGAGLTEIGLLGGLAQRGNTAPERARQHVARITEKAREMVTNLDEIVWSLNPRHDSLSSLSKYFCEYAQQFLRLTTVRCRLQVADQLPDHHLTSDQRNHLLMAFKEALNNVVRHAQATQVTVGITFQNDSLVITVTDDGRGWEGGARTATGDGPDNPGRGAPNSVSARSPDPGAGDGLDNLSARLEKLGGSCQFVSQPGHGTQVRMTLPLLNPTALSSGNP
ncbi:MAG: hypothetical protein C5B50_27405 [Verrucomicrobia bacterium]|nr:MAG: hypothetical protein C5B50_27405 [Verrucomicrobiota bacterium]